MARNKLSDLRNHLFEVLEALKDPDKPMELDRAKAISEVAKTLIETAKVEVDLMRALEISHAGEFFEVKEDPRLIEPTKTSRPNGGTH